MKELQGGGGAVAEMLGGKLVRSNTQDPAERQLLNVVKKWQLPQAFPFRWFLSWKEKMALMLSPSASRFTIQPLP